MPISKHLENQKLFTKTDILLASYPRSGNTWMRLLLSDAILQLQGIQTTTGGNIVPDAYKVSINEWNKKVSMPLKFRIIKTHEPLFFQKEIETQNRVFYLFRNPADCLCSYYYYRLRYCKDRESENEINTFCMEYLDQWCSHIKNYIEYKQRHPEYIIFLSYEKIHNNPVKVLNYILEILGFSNHQKICEIAVRNQEFKKVKSLSKLEKPDIMGFWEDHGYQEFFRQGKVDSAQKELSIDRLRSIREKAVPMYKIARAFEPIFDYEFSGELFEKTVDQNIIKNHFLAAKKYSRSEDYEKAIANYRKAIQINANSDWSYHNLGDVLGKINAWDEAIINYRQALTINPNSAWFNFCLANALTKQGNIDEAVTYYQKAIALKPNQKIIQKKLQDIDKEYHALAEKCCQENHLEEAIANYQKAIKFNPDSAWYHFGLGKALQYQGKVEDAIACYRKAIDLNPNIPDFRHLLGEALTKQEQLEEAISSYKAALELAPTAAHCYRGLGFALYKKGELEPGIDFLKRAIELSPKYLAAYNQLGEALFAHGDFSQAIACYEKSIELNPKSPFLYGQIAEILAEQGQIEQAVQYYRNAIKLDSRHQATHPNLVAALSPSE
ncbi:tetratricopeptide repeat protein [Limnospira fusiformis]|uniref:tetratricopeptide repeat protein n=1 Tax=Limnospira fusiformis TaxID=54297 RepID=UPI001449A004|nr:tetratricopeptide repeat protein [Limnospira fusiformis SAG 85.79]